MIDNTRKAIGYVCISLVVISWILGGAWIMSPRDFTFKIEMDNNTKDAIESIDYKAIGDIGHEQDNNYSGLSVTSCGELIDDLHNRGIYRSDLEYDCGTGVIETSRHSFRISDDVNVLEDES